MAIEDSRNLIKQMVADEYINGLLKDPNMRADMERAEPTKWDSLIQAQDSPSMQPEPPQLEMELEL